MRTRKNTMFKKIKKDFSSVWSMLANISAEDSEQNLDDYKAVSSEEAQIIEELKESERKIDAYANEYINSIGVPSKKKNDSKTSKKHTSTIDNKFINNKEFTSDNSRDIER